MSAVATFIEPGRVHLLADAAFYDETGALTAIESKIWPLPRAKAAFSSRGNRWAFLAFEIACESVEYDGFDEFVSKIDDIFAAFDMLMGDLKGEIIIAGWSDRDACGRSLFRKTHPRGSDDTEPGTIYIMGTRAGFGVDRLDLGDEWAEEHAVAAFQRARERAEDITYGSPNPVMAHAVGGHIGHAVVGPDGISGGIIHLWPEDEVGRRIEPACLRDAA